MVDESTIRARVGDLLRQYAELSSRDVTGVESLTDLIADRQRIIDEMSGIDDSLAVLQRAVAASDELKTLLAQIADLDRKVIERAQNLRDHLRGELETNGDHRRAARGYRLGVRRPAIMIDRSA